MIALATSKQHSLYETESLSLSNPNTCLFYGSFSRYPGEGLGQLHLLSSLGQGVSVYKCVHYALTFACLSWVLMNT